MADEAPTPAENPEPPPATLEPPEPRRLWIAAPGLIAPALLGLLFLLGAPQALRRTLTGGDRLEPNDTFAEALPLPAGVTPEIRCGLGDVDWFTVDVPQGKCLQLTTTPTASQLGATSVHDAHGAQLTRTRIGEERCVYTPESPEPHTVWIRVWSQHSRTYSLNVEFTEPTVRYEPNDEPMRATPVDRGHHPRLTCNGSDWFRVEQPAGRALLAKVESTSGVGVRLLPTTGAVAPVTSALPPTASAERVGATRALYAHVFGNGPYSLEFELGPPESKPAVASLPLPTLKGAFEPNDRREQAVALTPALYTSLRCNGKDWYSIEIPPNSTLTVRLQIDRNRGDLQLKLETSLPKTGGRSSRYGNYTKEGYELRHVSSGAESVRVLVSGSRMAYRLEVTIEPGLPGKAISAGEYPQLVCEGSDLWRIMLAQGERLTVELATASASSGWLDLTLYDRNWVARGSSNSGGGMSSRTFSSREAGPVFVQVTGNQIRYSLDVTVESDAPEKPFIPPSSEPCGPGVYPERVLQKEAYYAIELTQPGAVSIDVGFRNDQGDVDLELLDSFGRKLTRSSTTDDVEHVEHVFSEAQRFFARVYTYSEAAVDYELSVAIEGQTTPSDASAPLLEPGLHRVSEPTRHALYRVRLEAGERLAASIRYSSESGRDLGLAVHDARGREVVRSTRDVGGAALGHTALGAETVYLRVSGRSALAFELEFAVAKPE